MLRHRRQFILAAFDCVPTSFDDCSSSPGLSLARHFRRGPLTGYDAPQPVGNAMKRRSRAGGEPIKGRRHRAAKPNIALRRRPSRQMPFSPISPNKVAGNDLEPVHHALVLAAKVRACCRGGSGGRDPVRPRQYAACPRASQLASRYVLVHGSGSAHMPLTTNPPLRPGPSTVTRATIVYHRNPCSIVWLLREA